MKKVKVKKQMRKTVYDPTVESKYSKKMKTQAKGVFSPTSPFRPLNEREQKENHE